MSEHERWYFDHYRALHDELGRPPSVRELARTVERSHVTVYKALKRIALHGHLEQVVGGTFVPTYGLASW